MSRRRYRYVPNPTTGEIEAQEVPSDWTSTPRSTGDLGKFEYGCRMTDGTPVADRHDYKRYLNATGYVPVSEFKDTWANAAKERADGGTWQEKRERREAVGRAMYQRHRP